MVKTFAAVLAAAVEDLTSNGFDREGRLAHWTTELRIAAKATMAPEWRTQEMLRRAFGTIYKRLVERGGLLKYHRGVDRFTLQRVAPRLRDELTRRIAVSASLIKLNRDESIEKTLRRFVGWGSSIPTGGSDAVRERRVRAEIAKPLGQQSFVDRRVIIDQSHKLVASINNVVAEDGGAIALIWHSHWRQAGYDYREDHRERDGVVYLLRDTWATRAGLVKPGGGGWYDDVTAVGEEVFCRCYAQYIYQLRSLPDDMVTERGREVMDEARRKAREMMK